MRREKPSQTPKFSPSASSHFLGCAPKFLSELSQTARGNSPGVSPSPAFHIFQRTPGGVWGGVAALPRPPQCAKAPHCCGATRIQPGTEGRGENNRRRMSRFSPRILHERLSTQSRYQPPAQNTCYPLQLQHFQPLFSFETRGTKENRLPRQYPPRTIHKEENAEGDFTACGRRHGASPQTPPVGLVKYRKPGEGKLLASFPSPPEKMHGIATEMRRTAKEYGEAGRGTSAFEMVLSPLKQLKEYCFCCVENLDFSCAVGMYF